MVKAEVLRTVVLGNRRYGAPVVGILTQSMLMSEITQNLHLIGPNLRYKSVRDMTSMWQNVLKCCAVCVCAKESRGLRALSCPRSFLSLLALKCDCPPRASPFPR